MKQIRFKQKFYNLIIEGKKQQTIRFWKRLPNFTPNEPVECFFGFNHPKLNVIIINVLQKTFNDITQEEVLQDGFSSKEELLLELINFYPFFNKEKSILHIIKFKTHG